MGNIYDLQIARIRQKLAQTPGVWLNPPVSINQIEGIERDHKIRIPPAYRRFLLEIGDGGWFRTWPLYPLAKALTAAEGPLSAPFPFTGNWCIDGPAEASLMDSNLDFDLSGALPIFYFGCTHSDFLVMNGLYTGTVMYDGRGTDQGCSPYTIDGQTYALSTKTIAKSKRLDYLGWFERGLEKGFF